MKVIKNIKAMFKVLFLSILFILSVSVFATETQAAEYLVDDTVGLLTHEEFETIYAQVEDLAYKTEWNVLVITTDYADGKSNQSYTEDYYDEYLGAFDQDGFIIMINMDPNQRGILLSTAGEAMEYIPYERREHIVDKAVSYAMNENYYMTLSSCLQDINDYYDEGIPGAVTRGHWDLTLKEHIWIIILTVAFTILLMMCVVYDTVNKYYNPICAKPKMIANKEKSTIHNLKDQYMRSVHRETHISKRRHHGSHSSSSHHGSSGRSF